jgi:DNA recombination protein RmuC
MLSLETLVLILISVAGAVAIIIYFFTAQMKGLKQEMKNNEDVVLMEWLKEMKGSVEKNSVVLENQLKDQRQTLEQQLKSQRETLNQQTKMIWERLDNASEVIKGVQHQLGGIQEFGKDMKDLSNILKSPKLRGGLGEQFLYDILANTLPHDLYKTQYRFKNGSVCDAVVVTDKGLIPIDSKFPMEKFREMLTCENDADREKAKKAFINSVKDRVEEISSKYILPEEKTTEQAVMYVPAENVFYELIVNSPSIEDFCKQKGVVMASPNTLSYFLKIILVAYQQHELEKHAGEILKALSGIRVEAEKFGDDLGVLEKHISNSYRSMDNIKIKFTRLFGKIEGVQSLGHKEEQSLLLDKTDMKDIGNAKEIEEDLDVK